MVEAMQGGGAGLDEALANIGSRGTCARGSCAGVSCAGGPCTGLCAGGPQAGLWKNDRNQPAGFRVVVFRSRWQIQAERPQPSEDTIPPRLRNKGSVSSGSAFLAARASISACSIIKFFSLV